MATVHNNSHFSLQNNNNNFNQNFPMMTSPTNNFNNNLSPLPPQIFDFQQPQQNFVHGLGMGYDNNKGQEMDSFSFPCSSSAAATFANNNNIINNNNNENVNSIKNFNVFSQSFASLLDKHRREVDLYLHYQGERLKEALQQQKKQQMALLLNNYQSKAMELLRQKEEELEKLNARTRMLEELLKKQHEETGMWQRIAEEKEERVKSLNETIAMMKQSITHFVPQVPYQGGDSDDDIDNSDAESVFDCGDILVKNAAAAAGGSVDGKKNACKWCEDKEMSVVFLPCKHLCCCKECDTFLRFCPVCHSARQGSMEILIT